MVARPLVSIVDEWTTTPAARGSVLPGARREMPIIFVTGFGDVPTAVQAMPLPSWGCVLGDAARMCGDSRAARAHYERALAVAEAMHHQPEIALLQVGLADLLPRTETEELLDQALRR
jgi:hypothetical protein